MRTFGLCAFTLALTLASAVSQSEAETYATRTGGPARSEMVGRGHTPAEGMAFFRPVLSGVLYRAGFKGGDKGRTGLSSSQRMELCEAGFSSARYIDFGKKRRLRQHILRQGPVDLCPGQIHPPLGCDARDP